jgi:two-component sensor histidine kinase
MLLKEEIHHRVKNNLQVISSLLYLQSINVTEQATLDVLRESRSRVKSIALVHEKLHMSEDSEKLDFTEYPTDLLADLFGAYGAYQRGVTVNAQIKDIFLGIDTAIPCGLIINELASNALKHAFPDGMKGEVWIELYPLRDRTYTLVVRDNGVGLPLGFSLENTKSLGLKLVRDLTQQLDGKMEIETGNGSLFHITFKELLYKERW